jgi:hypothetical protein
MKLELHDADTTATKHGSSGPTHAGSVTVDYEYQAEEWVKEIEQDYPDIVRLVLDNGREWRRVNGRFEEVPRTPHDQHTKKEHGT